MQAARHWGDWAISKLTIMKESTRGGRSQHACPGHRTVSTSEILLKQLAEERFTWNGMHKVLRTADREAKRQRGHLHLQEP